MSLSPQTVLRRADLLKLYLDSYNEARISVEAGSFECGYHSPALLHAFRRPRSVASVLAELGPHLAGPQDWIELTGTIARLYQGGALVGDGPPPPTPGDTSFDQAVYAIEALNNHALVERCLTALRTSIRPGAVVVDLAGSTGLLAVAAAQAGAGRVYVRPAPGAAELLRAGIEANGAGERVLLLGPDAVLPQADLLLSEQLLTGPTSLALLAELRRAAGVLGPGGRTLPVALRRLALPVAVPPTLVARQTFTPATVADWQSWYGIDFGPCAEVAGRTPRLVYLSGGEARGWQALGAATLLVEERVDGPAPARAERALTLTATGSGALGGLLIFSELLLAPGQSLSTHPAAEPDVNLGIALWLLPQPLPVEPGAHLRLSYREPAATTACWLDVEPA